MSTKHGPHGVDEFACEVESSRREDAPVGAPSESCLVPRPELSRHLGPTVFPGTRREWVAEAGENAAHDAVVRRVETLPASTWFGGYAVWSAFGGPTERAKGRPRR